MNKMSKIKLTAVLIVKNEVSCIERCLNSLTGYDEIVVVDTGSTDGTQDICRKYRCTVYEDYVWNDDFSQARNHALSKVSNSQNSWCLSIDADEFMVSTAEQVREVIRNAPEFVDMISINCISECRTMTFERVPLFRNKGNVKWVGAVHETLVSQSQGEGVSISSSLSKVFGYSDSHKSDPLRNIRILNEKCDYNVPRTRFYLMREHWDRKMYDETLHYADEYLAIATWQPEICETLLLKARVLWQQNKGEQAREVCRECIILNPMFAEALYFMGELHYEPWRSKWRRLSEGADNSDVLFIRNF